MVGLEKQKHLKPFMSQSLSKLVDAFTGIKQQSVSDHNTSITSVLEKESIGNHLISNEHMSVDDA